MKGIMSLSAMTILLLSITVATQTSLTQTVDARTVPDFNFVAVGDWGCTSNTNKTVANIVDKNPELVLGLGDYSYEHNTVDCWFKIIDPIDDKMKIAIGNHDVGKFHGKLTKYMNYFGLREEYYSFDYQNVHFIALSTRMPFNINSTQYKFVKSDISDAASDPNIDWIVVYFHRQMYTSPSKNEDSPSLRRTYHPLFDKYGVDLVLQAHNHNYERTYPIKFNNTHTFNPIETSKNMNTYRNPEGEIFATVGTGGRSVDSFNGKEAHFVKQYRGFGILDVDITNNGRTLTGKFYANKNGTIIDQFTIYK